MIVGLLRWVTWNAFLALIPVAAGYAFAWLALQEKARRSLVWTLGLLATAVLWLIFLPNTCYLMTEWRHFFELLHRQDILQRWEIGREPAALFWLAGSALFFLLYSGFGMLTLVIATRPVARTAHGWWKQSSLLGLLFFPLLSVGVYLGLVLRFNSWDLLHRPRMIWMAAITALNQPLSLTLILLFAVFLLIAYLIIDIWIDGFLLRVRRSRASDAN